MATFRASYKGLGELLNADFIAAALLPRGEKVKARAEVTAPDYTPYGEGYKYEFEIVVGTKESKKGTRRKMVRVRNRSKHSFWVEMGGKNTPAYRILGKALSEAGE